MPAGTICYMEIPATDIEASTNFYAKIFGWKIRIRGDGERAFDEAAGAVSGSWVRGRSPNREPGVLVYIMVDNIDNTLLAIWKAGGEAVTPRTALGAGGEAYATFRDPAGNTVGLYQAR